jgi:hypothetical protein
MSVNDMEYKLHQLGFLHIKKYHSLVVLTLDYNNL